MEMSYFEKIGYVDYVPVKVVGATLRLIAKKHRMYKRYYHDDYKVSSVTVNDDKSVCISFITVDNEMADVDFSLDGLLEYKITAKKSGNYCFYMGINAADFICDLVSKLFVNTAFIFNFAEKHDVDTSYFDNVSKVDKIVALAMLDTSDSKAILDKPHKSYTVDDSGSSEYAYKIKNISNPKECFIYEKERNLRQVNENSSAEEFDVDVVLGLYYAMRETTLSFRTI